MTQSLQKGQKEGGRRYSKTRKIITDCIFRKNVDWSHNHISFELDNIVNCLDYLMVELIFDVSIDRITFSLHRVGYSVLDRE